jgi:hypothetical protein
MDAGLEPTLSDYEPDVQPIILTHHIELKGFEPLIFCSQNRDNNQTIPQLETSMLSNINESKT